MSVDPVPFDPITELRFALAESEGVAVSTSKREQMLAVVTAERTPGYTIAAVRRRTGPEVFGRMTFRLETLLGELTVDDWHTATIRGLDVQQLVGHLIAVEDAFAAVLGGSDDAGVHGDADHVGATQVAALGNRVDRRLTPTTTGCQPFGQLSNWSASGPTCRRQSAFTVLPSTSTPSW